MSDTSEKNRVAAAVARLTGTLELLEPTDAIDLLAGFIDANGAVQFSQLLEESAPEVGTEAGTAEQIEAELLAQLADIEARLDDSFAHAFRPRYRLPSAARAWSTLEQLGLLVAPNERIEPAAFRKASRTIWAPFAEFLETQLKRLRFALRDAREEVGGRLSGLGPKAAELVVLDRGLSVATQGVVDGLYRRIAPALEARFETRLRMVLKASSGEGSASLSGFGPQGWLGEILADAKVLYSALLGREGRRLIDLVRNTSVLDAGVRDPNSAERIP